jgi:hypothetical protein
MALATVTDGGAIGMQGYRGNIRIRMAEITVVRKSFINLIFVARAAFGITMSAVKPKSGLIVFEF